MRQCSVLGTARGLEGVMEGGDAKTRGARAKTAPVGRFGDVFLFNKNPPILTELDAADTLDMGIGIWIVGGDCDTLTDHFKPENTSKLTLTTRFVWDGTQCEETKKRNM